MSVATNVQPLMQGSWTALGSGPFRIEARPNPILLWWGDPGPTQGQPGFLIDAGQKAEIWTTMQVYASTPVLTATIIFAPISRADSSLPGGVADFSLSSNSSLVGALSA